MFNTSFCISNHKSLIINKIFLWHVDWFAASINRKLEMKPVHVIKSLSSVFAVLLFMITTTCFAQDQEEKQTSPFTAKGSIDVLSNFIWRGIALDPSPCLQPSLMFGNDVVEFGILGSYSLGGDFDATPVYLKFTFDTKIGSFSPMLFNYYYPSRKIPFDNFSNDNTGAHTLEASLTYKATVPLQVFVSANILNDTARSTYAEIKYKFKVKDAYSLEPFVGASLEEKSPWLAAYRRGVTNVGVTLARQIALSDEYSIPVSVSYSLHTQIRSAYLSARVSFPF